MSGFVTLQRKAVDHHLFEGDVAKLGAWFWLVAKACWKPTKFNVGGKTITLTRGQYCCSIRDLAEAWGWSKSSVDRYITRLKNETMIETSSGTGRLVITICNYDKYQDLGQKPGTAGGTPSGTKLGQGWDIKEPVNQEPNGSSGIRAHRDDDWPEIPDWVPAASWNGWLEVRKRKRDWPTARAINVALKHLDEWRAKGHDPGAVLDASTMNNWTGLFEPKDNRNGNGNRKADGRPAAGYRGPVDRRDSFTRAIDDAGGFGGPFDDYGAAG